MCGPQVAMGIQGAGAAASTVGAYYSAQSQKAALGAQAAVADSNARIAELTAQSTLLAGQREEQKSRLATSNLKGTQRASMAANGIDLGSDTAVNILTTTDVMGEIDANTIKANAVRSAWGYRTQGTNYSNQALVDRASGGSINPFMVGGSQFLTSASSVATNRYLLQKAGAFDSKPAFPWQASGNVNPAGGYY